MIGAGLEVAGVSTVTALAQGVQNAPANARAADTVLATKATETPPHFEIFITTPVLSSNYIFLLFIPLSRRIAAAIA
jgi:hypothetical protein